MEVSDPDETTTTDPNVTEAPLPDDSLKFLIIPLVVIVIVMLLSALVYLMAQRRRWRVIRENILHLYDMESNEEEWGSFNSYDHCSYNAMDYTTSV